DHLAFPGRPHAVALDRLGENDRRLTLVRDGRLVGSVDLVDIVSSSDQGPDLIIGPVIDQRRGLRVAPEEVLADISAVLRLEILVFAVDAFLHQLPQSPGRIPGEEGIPIRAPKALDDVPARAAKVRLELLHDLAVATHRPVKTLQIAAHDENEVVELLAACERDRPEGFRLVHLAVAAEYPHFAALGIGKAAAVQVAQETRLIDAHDGPQAHRHRGELPEVRHQPGVRIGGQSFAADLLAETLELRLAQPPLDESAGVDAGGAVTLVIDEIAAVALARGMPEVREAGVVERGGRLEAGDVPAQLGGYLIGSQNHRQCVP